MFPLMFAAIGGGIATASMMAPLGGILAVVSAPIGGSLCAVLAAVHLARQRGNEWQDHSALEEQTDAMVASLRGITAQADQPSVAGATPSRNVGTTRAA